MQGNHLPKVLVGAPISDKKDYCLWEWIDSINRLSYPNHDVFLVDNSEDPDYHRKLWEIGINCDHIEPEGTPVEYITKSQNIIRQYALDNDYDYLMFIECDVFCPPEIIEYLLHYDLPVVSGNYFLGEGHEPYGGGGSLRLSILDIEKDFRHCAKVEPISLFESFKVFDGKLKKVFATHLGATLICREVLDLFPFRGAPDVTGDKQESINNKSVFSDTYFFIDCMEAGVPVYSDMSILLRHDSRSWNYDVSLMI